MYFARARELAGCDREEMQLSSPTDPAGICRALAERHAALAPLLACSRIAVGQNFINGSIELHDHDEVAVIPPVSGG